MSTLFIGKKDCTVFQLGVTWRNVTFGLAKPYC